MSSLEEVLSTYLLGETGLGELSSALQGSQQELVTHQSDISRVMADIPDYLIATERSAWLSCFSKLERRIGKVEEDIRDRVQVQSLANSLAELKEELTMASLSVREAAWAARGPSTHPGVNELLFLIEQISENPSDEQFSLFQNKLDIEFSRFENQAQAYQELPEFAALAMEELLPEYRELLEGLSQIADLEDEDVESLFNRLEDWGMNFSVYDIDFLSKRYSQVPTSVPTVNFALNCQMLYLEELVNEDMVDYSIDVAVDMLRSGSEQFLEEQKLSQLARDSYDELLSDLISGLESLAEIEELDELREAGGEVVNLTARFIQSQSEAETESGSRLDFKSEQPS